MAINRALSIEDGNIQSSTIVTTRSRDFKDIDLSFERKVGTNDVYKKIDAAAVKQALKNLILTNRFEKPFDPNFGGDLRSMLFELADDNTAAEIERDVKNAAFMYEPRAEILEVKSNLRADNNSVNVTITFKIVNSPEIVTFTTIISRLR